MAVPGEPLGELTRAVGRTAGGDAGDEQDAHQRRIRDRAGGERGAGNLAAHVGAADRGCPALGDDLDRAHPGPHRRPVYVNEPDGFRDPFAFRAMLTHGENPVLDAG